MQKARIKSKRKNMVVVLLCIVFYFNFGFIGETNSSRDSSDYKSQTYIIDSTFTNPLLKHGADPWVIKKDGFYYYMHTLGNRIAIRKTQYMSELKKAEPTVIWRPSKETDHSSGIWGAELHYIKGKWFMYFTATGSGDGGRRMHVLECNSQDPTKQDVWSYKGQLAAKPDRWAIDGTILKYNNQLYMVWSGWESLDLSNSGHQQLYIAKMKNPWTLEGRRVMISEPTYSWEKRGMVNEAPEILKNKEGQIFIIYSASGCWTDYYCLGMLSLKDGGNPMNPQDWSKNPKPLLSTNASSGAYGTGSCSFFKSPDGTQDWIIYHANPKPHQGCNKYRNPRMQKIMWNADGMPYIGKPVRINVPLLKPSGLY